MYLNLDLLYNINNYLYPLFYYAYSYCCTLYVYVVYSPMTKKSVYKNEPCITYFDFITKNTNMGYIFDTTKYIFTENILNLNGLHFLSIKPFKLDSEDLYFLKSNTRIN